MSWVITFVLHSYDPATKKPTKEDKTVRVVGGEKEARSTAANIENNPNTSNVEVKEEDG